MKITPRIVALAASVAFLSILVFMAVFAGDLHLPSPTRMQPSARFAGSSWLHPFGQDEFGRDMMSRLVYGARTSLLVAAGSATISCVVGCTLGLLGGYFRRWVEIVTMRPVDVIMSFPPMLLALLAVAMVGSNIITLILIMSVLFVPDFCRIVYGETVSTSRNEYVEAARALGQNPLQIMCRTILLNIVSPILIQFSLVVSHAMVLEAGLSFLGLGVVPPTPSLGGMIRSGRAVMDINLHPLMWPCVILIATIFSINAICDSLRDVFDPRTRSKPGGAWRVTDTRTEPKSKPTGGSLLVVDRLSVDFLTPFGPVRTLNDFSLTVGVGEILALVGESGSGKTVTGLSIMQLLPGGGRVAEGAIWLNSAAKGWIDLSDPGIAAQLRGRDIGMIFQEPMTSLNPAYTVGAQLVEAIRVHQPLTAGEAHGVAISLLERVGIVKPERRVKQYPHEFSGGMLQRVAIAMAICNNPRLLIADEPTTALDVTVQSQILDLLVRLKEETGMAIVFITHDLSVVAEIADYIAVMYAGRIVEQGSVLDVFETPGHPYTQGLLASSIQTVPIERGARFLAIPGVVPSPMNLPPGCSFQDRCPVAINTCTAALPALVPVGNENHSVRCIRWKELQ